MPTAIEWTDETWNPVTGCSKVSPGCAYCYAERVSHRYDFTTAPWTDANAADNVVLHPDRLDQPLRWRRPRRIFVNSMSDLFHEQVPDEFIDRVFAVMALAPQHTFQVLTKRPERMKDYLEDAFWRIPFESFKLPGAPKHRESEWPFPNVWLGVSAELQRHADARIPLLLQTPAAVRFVSAEPLLGPLDLSRYLDSLGELGGMYRLQVAAGMFNSEQVDSLRRPRLDWVIVGGESGGPEARRLIRRCKAVCHGHWGFERPCVFCGGAPNRPGWEPKPEALAWVCAIRDQCQAAGVPLMFKQWGGPTPKSGGRLLDGRTWDEYPQTQAARS